MEEDPNHALFTGPRTERNDANSEIKRIRADRLEGDLSTFIQEKIRSQHCISRRSTRSSKGRIVVAHNSRDCSRREVRLKKINSPRRWLRCKCDKVPGCLRRSGSEYGARSGRKQIRRAHERLNVSGCSQIHCKISASACQKRGEKHRAIVQYVSLTVRKKNVGCKKAPTYSKRKRGRST